MSWLSRVINVFRAERVTDELDEELQFHVDSRARDLMTHGMTSEEAYRRGPAAARKRGRDSRAQPGREARRASGRRSAGPAVRDPDAASRPGRLTGRGRLAGTGDWRLHGGVRAGRCPDPSAVARPRAGDAGLCRRARRQRHASARRSTIRSSPVSSMRCGGAPSWPLSATSRRAWPHSTRQAERNECTDSSSPEMVLACSG